MMNPFHRPRRRPGTSHPQRPIILRRSLTIALTLFAATPALACENPLPFTSEHLPSVRVLAIGSSSTAGVGAGSKAAAYPNLLGQSLPIISNVEARGIGGEKAAGAVARMSREIADTNPHLVIWQVGTNDANARLDPEDVAGIIRDGIAIIRAANADVMLIDPQYYPRIADKPHYTVMAEMIDRIGEEECILVVDRFEGMRDSGKDTLPLLLARDRFHMSAKGHKLLADLIVKDIQCALDDQCKGE